MGTVVVRRIWVKGMLARALSLQNLSEKMKYLIQISLLKQQNWTDCLVSELKAHLPPPLQGHAYAATAPLLANFGSAHEIPLIGTWVRMGKPKWDSRRLKWDCTKIQNHSPVFATQHTTQHNYTKPVAIPYLFSGICSFFCEPDPSLRYLRDRNIIAHFLIPTFSGILKVVVLV